MSYIFDDIVLSVFDFVIVVFSQDKINNFAFSMVAMAEEGFTFSGYFRLYWEYLGGLIVGSALLGLVLAIGYFVYLPYRWDGQTVGRKVVGIKVVSTKSDKLSLEQLFVREVIFKFLWWTLTLGLGVIIDWLMILIREDKCTIRDLVAGTAVELQDGEYVKEEYNEF